MSRWTLPKTPRGQVLLCSAVSSIFLLPFLIGTGPNIVTQTYLVAAKRFWHGISPYSPPIAGTDWFKYSPCFAMFYAPLAALPPALHSMVWGFLNYTVYWIGLVRWVPAYREGGAYWFWLLAASMELDGSIRYQQVNALLTGLTLLAVAEYRQGFSHRALGLLSMATNFKVLPAPFLIGLARRPAHWAALVLATSALYCLPACVLGWSENWDWHREWIQLLLNDGRSRGILDLESAMVLSGAPILLAQGCRYLVGALSLALLCDFRRRPLVQPADPLWLCLGLTGILLFNLRTEVPTFVMAGPVLPILWISSRSLGGWKKKWVRLGILGSFFFISLIHNDIWPKPIFDPRPWRNIDKTFAVLGLWLVTLYLTTGCRKKRDEPIYSSPA